MWDELKTWQSSLGLYKSGAASDYDATIYLSAYNGASLKRQTCNSKWMFRHKQIKTLLDKFYSDNQWNLDVCDAIFIRYILYSTRFHISHERLETSPGGGFMGVGQTEDLKFIESQTHPGETASGSGGTVTRIFQLFVVSKRTSCLHSQITVLKISMVQIFTLSHTISHLFSISIAVSNKSIQYIYTRV